MNRRLVRARLKRMSGEVDIFDPDTAAMLKVTKAAYRFAAEIDKLPAEEFQGLADTAQELHAAVAELGALKA